MKLLVGLGNPGPQYHFTRHNAGFLFLDFVQQQLNLPAFSLTKKFQAETSKTTDLLLAKPQTFMNLSGQSVKQLVDFYRLNPAHDLIVAFDDLDFSTGDFKIQPFTGPKTHNGLNSIYDALQTQEFTHVRLGTDSREGDRLISPADYVLQKFSPEQLQLLQSTFPAILARLSF